MALVQRYNSQVNLRNAYNAYRIGRNAYNIGRNLYERYEENKRQRKETGDDKRDRDGNKYEDEDTYYTPVSRRIPGQGPNNMPRSTYRRNYKKRRYGGYKKYKTAYPPKLQRRVVTAGLGFPKMMKMTMKFNTQVFMSSTGLNAYNFSCNGVYNCDITSTTGTPMFFDKMAALYNHYIVLGSKIKVQIVPPAATTVPIVWGVFINDDSTTTPATIEACREQTSASWKTWTTGASPRDMILTKKFSSKKTFGGAILGTDSLEGTLTTNPSEQSMFTVFQRPVDGTTSITPYYQVEISYIVMWKETKDLSA